MTLNLGVRALLGWVNSLKLANQELTIDDLRDGLVIFKVVCMLKKGPSPYLTSSTDDPLKLIADFLQKDCRFRGASLCWNNMTDDTSLTIEIAKVLLLLVYHDMMNERCTLHLLDSDTEQEIANLTSRFVMESEGSVNLSHGLDAYLARRYLPVCREILDRTTTTPSSTVSTISSVSDDESPIFRRTHKIMFMEMQTVASSSVSKSPLQDIMNTPKFQLRKMQRQMIKERDYRDSLERELASKITLITQRESLINQLQYHLDKMKEEQNNQEQVTREQINELEMKNDTLHVRLNEMLKQNKDLKNTSLLMERKVDDLTDENGVLSSQVRAVCSQLATFEAEVSRLTETQASAQEEWTSKTSHLQFELHQATAQKELLTEQIQILQGKISCLEDEIIRVTKEEVGENMGPVMEREMFETKINNLRNELESTFSSLKKAELEVEAKSQKLADYQQEISQQKELLEQQKSEAEEIIQAKDEILDKIQKEMSEQRARLQQEIEDLKLQLEKVEQQRTEQTTRLQQHVAVCEQEIQKLKDLKKEKEDLLNQTEEKVKDLETRLCAAGSCLADRDQQINTLMEEVDSLTDETKRNKDEIKAKEEMLASLQLQKLNEQKILHDKIQTLAVQVDVLGSSLKQAEQQILIEQELLAKTQQENVQQTESLQLRIASCEEEIQRLQAQIQTKNEQLVKLQTESALQTEIMERGINDLKSNLESLNDSLTQAKEHAEAQQVLLNNQQQESAHQKELLQQQLSASEEQVHSMKEEIQTKEEEMNRLKDQKVQEAELLNNEIQDLKKQVECLCSSLKSAEETLKTKEHVFAEQQIQNSQQMELLQAQMVASHDEVKRLNAEINAREEQLVQLKSETSTHSQQLQEEIDHLTKQMQIMSSSLQEAKDQVQAKDDLLAKQQQDSTLQIEALKEHSAALEEKINQLQEEVQTKESEAAQLKVESSKESEVLQNEIQALKNQMLGLSESLKTATEQVQAKEEELAQKNLELSQEKETFKFKMSASEEEMGGLKEQIRIKEEQLVSLKHDSSALEVSLRKAVEEMQSKDELLVQKQQENAHLVKSHHSLEERVKQVDILQKQIYTYKEEIQKLNESVLEKEKLLRAQEKLQEQVESISQQLHAKEQMLLEAKQECAQQVNILQQQLCSVNAELSQHKESAALRLKEVTEELQVVTLKEKETLVEKEILLAKTVQTEKAVNTLEKRVEVMTVEAEKLTQAKQSLERETAASRKLESVLQQELEMLKKENEKLLQERETVEESKALMRDLQDQLSEKSGAVEHYKAQMENAANHYKSKKQLLQKSEEEVANLRHLMDIKEQELKSTALENKRLQLDLDQVQSSEKKLLKTVASLEAQLAYADRNLRAQNKIYGNEGRTADSSYLKVPTAYSSTDVREPVRRTLSSDSLDHSSLDDSLNSTRKLSAPEESSTPLVRSSERLAKRRALQAESLETLYFTPINAKQVSRASTHHKELESERKNPTSSVKRRRTTQVINITLTKKTPGCGEEDETFYSLASARSQPNLSSAHSARPVSMELFETPAKRTAGASDQLLGLPGLRRSTIHSQTTSTFCVKAENEPESGPDDWMRIAELQARNKACLPHLKSSYPIECETGRNGAFIFTDEELRTGDPSDTIRRVSMMPGQLQDSLVSHRQSLMLGQTGVAANTRSHRLSLMPGQLSSKAPSSAQLRSPIGTKRTSSVLSVNHTSPEKKVKASCFPRPLTPKNKNVISGSTSHLHPVLSPAERRQSMMFSIDNTPKKNNYLKKGLNKLRSSTRKSPGKVSKKSPAQTTSCKSQENMFSHPGQGRTGRGRNFKSPQPTSRPAKSPGLTSSARKIMRRMNV